MLIKANKFLILYLKIILIFIHLFKTVTNQPNSIKKENDCKIEVDNEFCFKESNNVIDKYLFYDVNPSEGFNLRRDVYIRMANLVNLLNKKSKTIRWTLVLPPWNDLYHWKNKELIQSKLDWSLFFDIKSLNDYVPVIELSVLLERYENELRIDMIYYLESNFEDFNNGEFNKMNIINNCDKKLFSKNGNIYKGYFWGYFDQIYASDCKTISFRGTNNFAADKLLSSSLNNEIKFIMINRAEVIIHEKYGETEYWNCRRSMRISENLVKKSNQLRLKFFNSNDILDNTAINKDWRLQKADRLKNRGGEYLGVHVRRGDFIKYRKTVNLTHVSDQIKKTLDKLNLKNIYLSTDGTQTEIDEIKKCLSEFTVVHFKPSKKDLEQFRDGGISIIDQLICAHAKFFIGTEESTFSYRIQEEREIIGFDASTTFNCFCNEIDLCNSNKWLIKY